MAFFHFMVEMAGIANFPLLAFTVIQICDLKILTNFSGDLGG